MPTVLRLPIFHNSFVFLHSLMVVVDVSYLAENAYWIQCTCFYQWSAWFLKEIQRTVDCNAWFCLVFYFTWYVILTSASFLIGFELASLVYPKYWEVSPSLRRCLMHKIVFYNLETYTNSTDVGKHGRNVNPFPEHMKAPFKCNCLGFQEHGENTKTDKETIN